MQVVTLISQDLYSSSHTVLGVFENMDAALERLKIMSKYSSEGEQYNIECFELVTEKEQRRKTTAILRNRAKREKQMQ